MMLCDACAARQHQQLEPWRCELSEPRYRELQAWLVAGPEVADDALTCPPPWHPSG